jgi:hypothetical protein
MLTAAVLLLTLAMFAGLTATLKSGFTKDGAAVENTVTVTGSGFREVEETVAANQTDKLMNIAFTYADLLWIYIESDAGCTIETNAVDATGGQTITITAGVPFFWQKNSGIPNPISANVTKIYVTNTTAITSFYMAAQNDATP